MLLVLAAGVGCGGAVGQSDGRDSGGAPDAAVSDATSPPDSSSPVDSAVAVDSSGRDSEADATGQESGPSGEAGPDGATDARVCAPGAARCSGSSVETCGANGQWGTGVPCAQPSPDCAAGACTCLETLCPGACADLQTDNANCGGCGLACSTSCTAGECVVTLSTGSAGAASVAVDGTSVYWAGNAVMKAHLDGSNPVTVSTTAGGYLVVDSQNIYWTSPNSGEVLAAPIAGGTPITLASSSDEFFYGLAVDGTGIYWGTLNGVLKAPLTGGGSVATIAADFVFNIVASHDRVWFTDYTMVASVDVDGGTPATIFNAQGSGAPEPYGIAVDGTTVFWTASDTVMSAALDGGTPTALASGQGMPTVMAVDGTSVYWAADAHNGIVKLPVGGGVPVTIVPGAAALSIAVDATSVYWANGTSLMKITPK